MFPKFLLAPKLHALCLEMLWCQDNYFVDTGYLQPDYIDASLVYSKQDSGFLQIAEIELQVYSIHG